MPYRNLPECWVRPQYLTEHSGKVRYPTLRYVRYALNTWYPVPDTSVNSVLHTSIPVPDTSIRVYILAVYRGYLPYRSGSVRPQYPTEQSSMVWYELDIRTRHCGNVRTTSIPVRDTPVCSVQLQYRYSTRLFAKFGTLTTNTPGTGVPYRAYQSKICPRGCATGKLRVTR